MAWKFKTIETNCNADLTRSYISTPTN
jgi:hypothetical protein